LADPWYDKGGRYGVVNTVTNTGVGWRTDMITIDPADFENPWDMLWDPSTKGKVALMDSFRESMAMAFYRNGGMDPNTSSQDEIDKAKEALLSLVTQNDARLTNTGGYLGIPEGKFAIAHAFNGDMTSAQYFLPKGQSPSILRYVWPRSFTQGRVGGHIGTDNFCIVRGARNPVLAHLFINFAISTEQAWAFYAYIAYQLPQKEMTPDSLTAKGLVPENLASTILRPEDLAGAAWLQTLEPALERTYLDAWMEVQRGA
jgi:spermidine/putrescine-binding protein